MRLWKISYTSIAALPEDTAHADALVICALAGIPSLVLLAWLQAKGHFRNLGNTKV